MPSTYLSRDTKKENGKAKTQPGSVRMQNHVYSRRPSLLFAFATRIVSGLRPLKHALLNIVRPTRSK